MMVEGEIHHGEAVEEKISLSGRFGLWVAFHPFSQDRYVEVVRQWVATPGPAGRGGHAVDASTPRPRPSSGRRRRGIGAAASPGSSPATGWGERRSSALRPEVQWPHDQRPQRRPAPLRLPLHRRGGGDHRHEDGGVADDRVGRPPLRRARVAGQPGGGRHHAEHAHRRRAAGRRGPRLRPREGRVLRQRRRGGAHPAGRGRHRLGGRRAAAGAAAARAGRLGRAGLRRARRWSTSASPGSCCAPGGATTRSRWRPTPTTC